MVRKQVYLTEQEDEELSALAEATGKKPDDLIREAVDRLIAQSNAKHRQNVLDRAAGLWKDREDLPDFRAVRGQWDRG